jgi:gliding motility-associated lipoprotein GldH
MKRNGLPLLLGIILLIACDPGRVYENNIDIPGRYWHQDSLAVFNFHVEDVSVPYNLYYNLRNTIDYPYQNLYITHYLEDSLGNRLDSALNNVVLFDPKTGEPVNGGLGDIYDHQVEVLSDFQFPQSGGYVMKLEQFMRLDSLPEIVSIGIRVEKVQENP